MVLPNVLCALNFASSLMINGACCYYHMQEEDSRRKHQEDSIQKAIQKELDMRKEQEKKDCERRSITSHFESERRRKLMAQKQSCIREQNFDEQIRIGFAAQRQQLQQYDASPLDDDYSITAKNRVQMNHQELCVRTNSTLSRASTFSTGWGKAIELSSLMDEDSQVDEVELEEIMLK
ncbi:hypothetical protein IV203_019388 [Nitzschia inconspicua]|uniref:Uncharacterized protein n=1 Tax=Nitzschia inconspicua TaxID=303405 RepID=A0A9K3LZB3_9STRA|nr:hypothetical protein IV203_019388 [Nitzschia inconspicua]